MLNFFSDRAHRPLLIRWLLTPSVIIVVTLAVAAGCFAFLYIRNDSRAQLCQERLLKVYAALERYEIDKGKLPTMAFFPDDPKQDKDSPLVVLGSYGSDLTMFQCPVLPKLYRDLGLAYVWNTSLNGTKLGDAPEPVWMMVEISALSEQLPAPHFGCYHILYTDGTVRQSKTPPRELGRF